MLCAAVPILLILGASIAPCTSQWEWAKKFEATTPNVKSPAGDHEMPEANGKQQPHSSASAETKPKTLKPDEKGSDEGAEATTKSHHKHHASKGSSAETTGQPEKPKQHKSDEKGSGEGAEASTKSHHKHHASKGSSTESTGPPETSEAPKSDQGADASTKSHHKHHASKDVTQSSAGSSSTTSSA